MPIREQNTEPTTESTATAPAPYLDLPDAPILFTDPRDAEKQKTLEDWYYRLRQSLQRVEGGSGTGTGGVTTVNKTVVQQTVVSPSTQTILPIDATVSALGLQRKVFIGVRTDGQPGSGKLHDPFNGSDVDKFDTLMQDPVKITANSEIILLPGVFETRGFCPTRDAVSWRLRPGCKLRGCGIGVTTLKLVDATVTNEMYNVVWGWHWAQPFDARDAFWYPDLNFYYDDCEVSDMTIDCNFNAQPANAGTPTIGTQAVTLDGSRIKVSRVRVIHFGNACPTRENFVIGLGGPNPAAGDISDLTVEDCIMELPDYNKVGGTGIYVIMIFGGEVPPVGDRAWSYNAVVRGNSIDGKFSDGVVPTYRSPIAGHQGFNGAVHWGAYNTFVEGNKIKNSGGLYTDTWSQKYAVIRNNSFWNSNAGVYTYLGLSSPYNGQLWTFEKLVIENNDFALLFETSGSAFQFPFGVTLLHQNGNGFTTPIYKDVLLRGNRVHLIDSDMTITHGAYAAFSVYNTTNLQIEDNVIRLPWCLGVETETGSKRASIVTRNVTRVTARNNRRPEDNSIIVPFSLDRNDWLTDECYELEKGMRP